LGLKIKEFVFCIKFGPFDRHLRPIIQYLKNILNLELFKDLCYNVLPRKKE